MVTRIALLFSISLIMRLTAPLLGKCTLEIHGNLEGEGHGEAGAGRAAASFGAVVVQIMILDIVFSLDSVITAIGLADQLAVMVAAIVIAVLVMMSLAGIINRFVDDHPTIKILALSFPVLVGVSLIGEGMDFHIPKGYIYFAMAFSTFVEMLNLRIRKGPRRPVKLHQPRAEKIGGTVGG